MILTRIFAHNVNPPLDPYTQAQRIVTISVFMSVNSAVICLSRCMKSLTLEHS